MRWFLKSMVFCAVVIAGMAVLNHRGDIHMPTFSKVVEDRYVGGQIVQIHRMGSTGLFGDPNDLCLMLAQNVILCAYLIADHKSSLLARAFWIAPLALLGHAMVLTDSRGGLAALLGGLGVYLIARFGKKSIPLGVVCFPVLLALFAGRQTNFELSGGTGQARIQLWSDHMMLFRGSPVFGIGCNRSTDTISHVAHNSYVSMYEELGFGGGTLFLGVFCLALWELVRRGSRRIAILDPELARMRPYLAASVACYLLGMMSLTRGYLAPTYNILGIAAAYIRFANTDPPVPPIRLDGRLIGRFFLLGVGFLIGITLFIRFQVRYG
jgi:O-antigen ligase